MGAKPTTNHPPTPNVMPMVPPMMSSPVVGTMPPPPAIPATLQSSTQPSVSNLMPSTVMPTPPPSSEVASNASSGGMGSPSPQQMMPASIPDVPLFGTGPTSGVDAQIEPTFISPEAVQVHSIPNAESNFSDKLDVLLNYM